jgi:ribonuclease Y
MQGIWLILDSIIAVLALVLGFILHKWISERKIGDASRQAQRLVDEAERDAANRLKAAELEVKEATLKSRAAFEDETRQREGKIQQIEQRVLSKEEELARKLDQLERRLNESVSKERDLTNRERSVTDKESRLASALDEQRRKLESIASLTAEEAKRQLLAQMEIEAKREAQLMAMRLEEEARETAQVKAREVLATTIQRLAPDYTVETAVSVVDLPSDDMKGRIIGREGRNIRALELHTGVDLIVDDTPEAVLISAYDPYRREIARRAPAGVDRRRPHPSGAHRGSRREDQEGDGAAPEGRGRQGLLRDRRAQSAPRADQAGRPHEVPHLVRPELPAALQGSRVARRDDGGRGEGRRQARQAHGPPARHRQGAHARAGGQPPRALAAGADEVQRVGEGHQRRALRPRERRAETIEAVLVEAADGISAARPGARRDVLESYIKRLAKLEEIALSYKGVEMCYAIQAGRELRVMTKADIVSDLDAHQLAKDISKRIEAEMQYPGHIKVIVIRETRAVEVAK